MNRTLAQLLYIPSIAAGMILGGACSDTTTRSSAQVSVPSTLAIGPDATTTASPISSTTVLAVPPTVVAAPATTAPATIEPSTTSPTTAPTSTPPTTPPTTPATTPTTAPPTTAPPATTPPTSEPAPVWVGDLTSLSLTAAADCGGPGATVRVYGTVTGASRGTVELDRTLTVAVPVTVPVELVRGVGATVPFEVANISLDSDTAGATSATLRARIVGTLAGSGSMTLPGDPGGAPCTISVRFIILAQDARSV